MRWNARWCSKMPPTVTAARSFFDVLLLLCSGSADAGAANNNPPATASAKIFRIPLLPSPPKGLCHLSKRRYPNGSQAS